MQFLTKHFVLRRGRPPYIGEGQGSTLPCFSATLICAQLSLHQRGSESIYSEDKRCSQLCFCTLLLWPHLSTQENPDANSIQAHHQQYVCLHNAPRARAARAVRETGIEKTFGVFKGCKLNPYCKSQTAVPPAWPLTWWKSSSSSERPSNRKPPATERRVNRS